MTRQQRRNLERELQKSIDKMEYHDAEWNKYAKRVEHLVAKKEREEKPDGTDNVEALQE